MKQLLIVSHYDPGSFTAAVAEEARRIYSSRGHEVRSIDLYAENFDPVYRSRDDQSIYAGGPRLREIGRYQVLISWADNLNLIYPCWWTGFPAIMKGFIDRVLTNGFAVELKDSRLQGLLKSKKATRITLTSFPSDYYDSVGMTEALIKTSDAGIFQVCGIESRHLFCGSTRVPGADGRKAFLESLSDWL
jgi:NAD(P)H dehydrogenase (quinone)